MKKSLFVSMLALTVSLNAFAAEKSKIYCVFQTPLQKGASESSYVTQYVMAGSMEAEQASLSVKRTEFGVAKIHGKFVVDPTNINNKDILDVPFRKFVISSKNNSTEWKTFVPKTPVGDGYIAHVSLTLSNVKVSGENYGNSYKAIYSETTLGDDSNYTQKVYGTCSLTK